MEHNAKMNTAMYKMVLQKHLKASIKMTGTEVFMQDGATCHSFIVKDYSENKLKLFDNGKGIRMNTMTIAIGL